MQYRNTRSGNVSRLILPWVVFVFLLSGCLETRGNLVVIRDRTLEVLLPGTVCFPDDTNGDAEDGVNYDVEGAAEGLAPRRASGPWGVEGGGV